MSLILEALRKLEREKQSPDAGLVVVGHTPWTAGSPGRSRSVLIALGVALVAGGIGLGIWLGRAPSRVSTSPPAATAVAPPLAAGAVTPSSAPASSGTAGVAVPAPAQTEPIEPPHSGAEPADPPEALSIRVEPSGAPTVPPAPPNPVPVAGAAPRGTAYARTPAGTLPRATPGPSSPVRMDPVRSAPSAPEPEAEGEREAPAVPHGLRGELKLQAISQRDGHPIAVINERLVREGESFDGVLVVKIGKSEVEVEVGGRRKTLTF